MSYEGLDSPQRLPVLFLSDVVLLPGMVVPIELDEAAQAAVADHDPAREVHGRGAADARAKEEAQELPVGQVRRAVREEALAGTLIRREILDRDGRVGPDRDGRVGRKRREV